MPRVVPHYILMTSQNTLGFDKLPEESVQVTSSTWEIGNHSEGPPERSSVFLRQYWICRAGWKMLPEFIQKEWFLLYLLGFKHWNSTNCHRFNFQHWSMWSVGTNGMSHEWLDINGLLDADGCNNASGDWCCRHCCHEILLRENESNSCHSMTNDTIEWHH